MRFLWVGCLLALAQPALAADALVVVPQTLQFAYQMSGIFPATQAVVLASSQTTAVTTTRTIGQNWLTTATDGAAVAANLPVSFPIGVNPTNLAPGTYTSNMVFQSSAGSQTVKITLQVSAPPVLLAGPAVLLIDTTLATNGLPLTETVSFAASNGASLLGLGLTATSSVPWITAKAAGSAAQITIDRAKTPGGVFAASVALSANGMSNSPMMLPVITFAQPAITRVVNAATFQDGPIAPGEIVTIGGLNIGPGSLTGLALDSAGNVATSLAGVEVLMNGVLAPMVYAATTQISVVAPYELAGKPTASIQVVANAQTSAATMVNVVPAAPGIFSANASGTGPGAILNQDNTINSPSNPAAKGSTVVVYATGEGQTNPIGVTGKVMPVSIDTPAPVLPVAVTVDGQSASYSFAAEAPGFVSGVLQVNVQIPENARSGDLPLVVSVGGTPSQQGITVSVK